MKATPEGAVRTPDACTVCTDSKVEAPSFSAQGYLHPPPGGAAPALRALFPPHRLAAMRRRVFRWARRASAAGHSALRPVRTSRPTARPGGAHKSRRAQPRGARHRRLPRLRPCSLLCARPGSSQACSLARAVRRHPPGRRNFLDAYPVSGYILNNGVPGDHAERCQKAAFEAPLGHPAAVPSARDRLEDRRSHRAARMD